jgi:chromosome segregation ATPase
MDSTGSEAGWLDDFESKVDEALADSPFQAQEHPPAQRALEDFEDWWRGEHPAPLPADPAGQELRALTEEVEALRAGPGPRKIEEQSMLLKDFQDERKSLQKKLDYLERENADLTRYRREVQGQVVELRLKMSKAQEGYESHILQLAERLKSLEEQLRALGESKKLLQEHAAQLELRAHALDAQLKAALEIKNRLESGSTALECRAEALRASLSEREAELANREGTLAELRARVFELQERLRAAPAPKPLPAQEPRAEEGLAEAMRFLEMKLREMSDRNDERFSEFRDLLDAVARWSRAKPG